MMIGIIRTHLEMTKPATVKIPIGIILIAMLSNQLSDLFSKLTILAEQIIERGQMIDPGQLMPTDFTIVSRSSIMRDTKRNRAGGCDSSLGLFAFGMT
jgi:hypothetical protein